MANILLVDDSQVELRLAAALLSAAGAEYNVTFAEDGHDALEQLARGTYSAFQDKAFDLVITDLIMPNMGGLELLEEIRRLYPRIPVIVLTAYGNESIAVDALERGAASYVPKARQAECLRDTVARVLARRRCDRPADQPLQLGKIEATFRLDNNPERIAPLVDLIQRLLASTGLYDDMQCIRVGIALEEALSNAMLHGNRDMDGDPFELPPLADAGERWRGLLDSRRGASDDRGRQVVVDVSLTGQAAQFVIRDEGKGFKPSFDLDPADAFEVGRNRGLTLMKTLMDDVTYNKRGNQVTLLKMTGTGHRG